MPTSRDGGLEMSVMTLVGIGLRRERKCQQGHGQAPLRRKIMASGTHGLADTFTQTVDEAADLLDSCPRGSDNADAAASDSIGKGQRHAIDVAVPQSVP